MRETLWSYIYNGNKLFSKMVHADSDNSKHVKSSPEVHIKIKDFFSNLLNFIYIGSMNNLNLIITFNFKLYFILLFSRN